MAEPCQRSGRRSNAGGGGQIDRDARQFGVVPRAGNPVTAIEELLAAPAGLSDLLGRLLAETDTAAVLQTERDGVLVTGWVEATDQKLRAAKVAIDSKLITIPTNLATAYGERTLDLREAILSDLGLDAYDERVREVVGRRLATLSDDRPCAIEAGQ